MCLTSHRPFLLPKVFRIAPKHQLVGFCRYLHDHYWLSLEITLVRSLKVPFKNDLSYLKCEIEQFWIGHFFLVSVIIAHNFPLCFHTMKNH